MVFQERTYSVLVVSASDKFNSSIMALLPVTDYWPVNIAKSISEAKRKLLDTPVDILLINAPLTDDFGMRLAIDVCNTSDAGVLLLVKNDLYNDIYAKVVEYGVMTLPKPTSSQMVAQCLRSLCATRERLRKVEERQATVEEKIEEIRLINRAKWHLIECLSMTETEAHRYIEKQAMDLRISKREVAENIIKTYQ
ncbi:MAG: ANTAR domain-containing protein [Oscillospiraceae bacterium]|nr:ANTAR domain-containing protein [Oscillospiraceae bacterium]MBR5471158.1 ANTAR domain-containing protein [Oscillibacter sp.]